ncbi:unnamed protein product [Rotaria sordida]|uniref:N-acetyltransferase domain-containing protein n=1 Tax=Rotaria sordida TaxID=392033 RepID=A0A814BNN8_9BILA|nr:unnamed protein product [Rotaria sordida]
MLSVYETTDRPKEYNSSKLESLLPIGKDESKLICYLQSSLNNEIEAGNTYAPKFPFNLSEFKNYFLVGDVFIIINSRKNLSIDFSNNLENAILGTFYIKPNFPGRYSHICNGGFITSNIYRNQGIGRIMALAFIKITPLLCYKASMFNLVFSNNTFSIRLWRSLGFQEIGRILNAGYLIKKKKKRQNK